LTFARAPRLLVVLKTLWMPILLIFCPQIAPKLKLKLETAVDRLLKTLDANLKRAVDPKDVSVYTGTTGIALLYYHLAGLPNKKSLLKV
jgi:hypothetical protein